MKQKLQPHCIDINHQVIKQKSLIGTWRLVRPERYDENGRVSYPLGRRPRGFLIYSADGYMSVTMMAEGRRKFKTATRFIDGTAAEKIAAAENYFSYAGSYKIHGNTVIHQVNVCLFPNLPARLSRKIELSHDRLTLTTAPFEANGHKYTARIIWKRA